MLPGFNTNIRHRTVLFHVQSEDSGKNHPHIITHLYYGGTILKSEKSSYADRVEEPDLPSVVKQLMEQQHKTVLKQLRAGSYDELIAERLGEVFPDDGDTKADTKPSETAPAIPNEPSGPDPTQTPAPARPFGEGIVSERPLDEVILGYLVENARKRKKKQ